MTGGYRASRNVVVEAKEDEDEALHSEYIVVRHKTNGSIEEGYFHKRKLRFKRAIDGDLNRITRKVFQIIGGQKKIVLPGGKKKDLPHVPREVFLARFRVTHVISALPSLGKFEAGPDDGMGTD